jgi:ribosomal protein S18 acetylase RimI-like enzyme
MTSLRPLTEADIPLVRNVARSVWQATYAALISQAQIDYMLADRYAPTLIRTQLDDAHHAWGIAWVGDEMAGFAHAKIQSPACKIEKLYILPNYQRQGLGRSLINEIKAFARGNAANRLWLQVNRHNTGAIAAYQQYGFVTREARVFDIGGGFVMDDYVMETPL